MSDPHRKRPFVMVKVLGGKKPLIVISASTVGLSWEKITDERSVSLTKKNIGLSLIKFNDKEIFKKIY